MYEQFSGQARRAVYLAYEEAQRLKQEYVGTEHLLVGILNEGSEGVGNLLTACGLDPREIHRKVGFLMPAGLEVPDWSKLPLTPSAKRTFDYARDEAARLKHPWVFPEHLLVAILRDQGSTAAFVMTNLGLTLPRLTSELARLQLPANRDSMLQSQNQPGRIADPTSRDLDVAVTHRALPDEPILDESFPFAQIQTKLPEPLRVLTPAEQDLALARRQLLALKVMVACIAGVRIGQMSGRPGGPLLCLAIVCLLTVITNPIVTAVIGACMGGYMGMQIWNQDPIRDDAPVLGAVVGFLLGFCMGTWRRREAAPPASVNPHTDQRSTP
jgi:hypothetical protein